VQPEVEHGPTPRIEGPDGAPVVIVHADLSCPDCALALHRLGQHAVRIDLRHFVVRSRGEAATRAAHAAEAADVQGAFWPFARGLLGDQGRHDPPHLWALAASLGLDVDRFETDRRAESAAERIAQETRQALMGGATGIPAVFADAATADFLARSGYDAEVRIRRQK
jgi:protein-disulfide isomerase